MRKDIILLLVLMVLPVAYSIDLGKITYCKNDTAYFEDILSNVNGKFDYAIVIPQNFSIKWNVDTTDYLFEKYEDSLNGVESNVYHWQFEGKESTIHLNYSLDKPEKQITIYNIWVSKNSFERKKFTFDPKTCTSNPVYEGINKVYIANASSENGGWWDMASLAYYVQQGMSNISTDFWIGLLAFLTYMALFGIVYKVEIRRQSKKIGKIKTAKKTVKKKVSTKKTKVVKKKASKTSKYDKVLEKLKKIEKELK